MKRPPVSAGVGAILLLVCAVRDAGIGGHVRAEMQEGPDCAAAAPPLVVEWICRNAIPVATTRAGAATLDLRPLRRIIGNARVVGLGESVHGVQEFFEVRHRLLRFLVEEMGFTAFAMETGFAEAARINDYVLGRIEEPARWEHNWFTWGFGAEEELQSLVRWMRAYNADSRHVRKLRFYGVDVAVTYSSPLAAVQGAVDYLAQVDKEFAASSRRRALESLVRRFEGSGGSDDSRRVSVRRYEALPVEVRDAYTAAVADLINRFETGRPDFIRASSEARYEWAFRHAIAARQMDAAFRATAASDRVEVANTRDRAMADNTLWALEREGPKGRLVFWAHNSHLQKDKTRPEDPAWGVRAPLTRAGEYLATLMGPEYVNVGFSYYSGATAGWMSYLRGVGDPAACGSVDAEFDRAGLPMYLVDLRRAPRGPVADWLDELRPQRTESAYTRLSPSRAWDAVLHMRRITPAKRAGS